MPPLLLLLLLAVPVAPATLFVISGNVFCRLNYQFTDVIILMEEDVTNDDYLNSLPEISGKYRHEYNITASDTHDGWFNGQYELRFDVIHTCSSDGKRMMARFKVGEFAVNHGTHYINFDMDLTNSGDSPGVRRR